MSATMTQERPKRINPLNENEFMFQVKLTDKELNSLAAQAFKVGYSRLGSGELPMTREEKFDAVRFLMRSLLNEALTRRIIFMG